MQAIGERIKLIRKEREMSQPALAQASGLTQPFISKIESGAQSPSPNAVDKLAKALGRTGQELVEGTDHEGAYLADRLSPEEFKKKSTEDAERSAIERAANLNMLMAYYRRVVSIFEAMHDGYIMVDSPVLEESYQRMIPKIHQIISAITDVAPDAPESIHLPETTDTTIRAGGVESDMVGIEVEAIWDYLDKPAFAKSMLYLRQLRQAFPECEQLDIVEACIEKGLDGYAGLKQIDGFVAEYRRKKAQVWDRMLKRASGTSTSSQPEQHG